ncbi:MAG: alpha/beta hydrolase [Chloroflexi bacterium]|nr:alpha/beta hydrolase [Chloroflexota bacterium]
MTAPHIRRVRNFDLELVEAGSGPPLLFLHGIWDFADQSFVERLGERFSVLAPRLPGFGGSTGEHDLLDVYDAVHHLLDVADALGVENAPLVGHCLGGMFAAELAATQPNRFSKLALIAPWGLWLEANPALDFFAAPRAQMAAALHGPNSPEAREATAPPAPPPADETAEQQSARIEAAVERSKAMTSAARFLWPIPNRGLSTRLHRVGTPTLLLWGQENGVLSPDYGRAFQQQIAGARLEVIPDAAHMPHLQQPHATLKALDHFLAD